MRRLMPIILWPPEALELKVAMNGEEFIDTLKQVTLLVGEVGLRLTFV
jgi:hypothetical protein